MSKQEKAIRRLVSKPADYSWKELVSLMKSFSFILQKGGGSGRKFVRAQTGTVLFMHEPHPGTILKAYQVRDAIDMLKREGFLP